VELIVAPIYLKEGNFYYCYVYYAGRPAFFYSSFPFGLGILLITGAALSFAFAYYLAKPLRLLQTEVLAINNENLSDPLTVRNPVEVADVTCAINQLKSSLSQHIQSVHELMANVSHEMRSPLMRLTLAATFIEDGLNDARNRKQIKQKNGNARLQTDGRQNNDEYVDKQALAAKYLVYLKEDLTHMEKIVDTTLLSSKLDLQAEKDFVDLDFSRLCRDALGAQSMLAADKNLQMQVFVEDGVVMHADETLMRQVVFNLLDNAVKYSTQGSSISAGLKREDDRIVFCVENACPQLSEEKITRLFEPFYRAGKIGGTGVGLGLSLVKKIVTLHDGRVNAEHTGTALSVNVIFSVKQSTGEKMCGEKPCTQSASYQCLDRLCKQVPRDV
jgi:signal transduction histidine kinase